MDDKNDFEHGMLARELFLLLVQSELAFQMKRGDQKFLLTASMAEEAYRGADAFIAAGKEKPDAE